MPDNQSSDTTATDQWLELNSTVYYNVVQTLYVGQLQALRLARALGHGREPDQAGVKSLTRFRHRLQVKRGKSSLKRRSWNG
ncbi:MAG: hypothetical protein JWP00_61 [Chloroflexi bacterium]|jgi:hypothetical protein|nr:hypothetical protein [Chloroflexota bacterium]